MRLKGCLSDHYALSVQIGAQLSPRNSDDSAAACRVSRRREFREMLDQRVTRTIILNVNKAREMIDDFTIYRN